VEVRRDAEPATVHIGGVGEVLDDVVGQMVNRKVIVSASRRGKTYLLRDIELDGMKTVPQPEVGRRWTPPPSIGCCLGVDHLNPSYQMGVGRRPRRGDIRGRM
jgi:hypothetical protein